MQKELRDLAGQGRGAPPSVDIKKILIRVGAIVAVLWVVAIILRHVAGYAVAGVVTALAAGGTFWFLRLIKKQESLGAILRSADTDEGRKEALKKLGEGYKKDDAQALLARAQLEMQEDPRKALATLEQVKLEKLLGPMADQVRVMRGMLHLTLGEPQEAKVAISPLDPSKQQDTKTRAMAVAVCAEAWARTGQAKRALDSLELINPEDPELADLRIQLWRARAFAYAAATDTKGVARALKKLAEASPQLLGMFVGSKKVHPLLEREAKNMLVRSGMVSKKVIRPRA